MKSFLLFLESSTANRLQGHPEAMELLGFAFMRPPGGAPPRTTFSWDGFQWGGAGDVKPHLLTPALIAQGLTHAALPRMHFNLSRRWCEARVRVPACPSIRPNPTGVRQGGINLLFCRCPNRERGRLDRHTHTHRLELRS